MTKELNDMVIFDIATKRFVSTETGFEPMSPDKSRLAQENQSAYGTDSPNKTQKGSPLKRRTMLTGASPYSPPKKRMISPSTTMTEAAETTASKDEKKKDKDGTELSSTAQEQVLFRATTEDKQKWEECSKHLGISMAEFLRVSANEKVERSTAVCEHSQEFRKIYPWKEECLKCGKVLWAKNDNTNYGNRR